MARAELLERYRALPLPSTTEESWRFTDLKGFDPDAYAANGAVGVESAPGLLELDAAGIVHVSEAGIEIERAPEGIRFERLEDHPRLGELVGADEKFAAHNAAALGERPARARPEGRRAREAAVRADHEHGRGGIALLAAARRRRARVAVHSDRGVRLRRLPSSPPTRMRPSSSSSGRPRSSSTSRSRISRARPGTSPRTTPASSATPSSTGSPAASARRRARSGSRTTWPARARPRASPARTSPTATSTSTTTPSRSTWRRTRPRTSPSRARSGTTPRAVWRGMIRVEKDAQKTNAYQENRNLLLSAQRARGLDPRPRDHGERRPLHPRRHHRPGRPRAALLPDGPRPLAGRGGAPDRPRLLPGHPRPHRARAGPRGARQTALEARIPVKPVSGEDVTRLGSGGPDRDGDLPHGPRYHGSVAVTAESQARRAQAARRLPDLRAADPRQAARLPRLGGNSRRSPARCWTR